MKFVSDGLRERRSNVLADFNFARESGDDAVFADVQPGSDVFRLVFIVAAARAAAGFLRVRCARCDGEYRYASPQHFEEVTTRQVEVVDRSGAQFVALCFDGDLRTERAHDARPFAAMRTASTIFG